MTRARGTRASCRLVTTRSGSFPQPSAYTYNDRTTSILLQNRDNALTLSYIAHTIKPQPGIIPVSVLQFGGKIFIPYAGTISVYRDIPLTIRLPTEDQRRISCSYTLGVNSCHHACVRVWRLTSPATHHAAAGAEARRLGQQTPVPKHVPAGAHPRGDSSTDRVNRPREQSSPAP